MMRDFGIDLGQLEDLWQQPRLVFAEQPGSWFCARDQVRWSLLESLRYLRPFDPAASGVYTLANDAFTSTGDKRIFLWLDLHAELGPVRFIGSSFIRGHCRRTYASLVLEGSVLDRMTAIFSICERLLTAAISSPEGFAATVKEIFTEKVRPGIRDLLPARYDHKYLRDLGLRLAANYDLVSPRNLMSFCLQDLEAGVSWGDYWHGVNRRFLNTNLHALGPLLNRFVLAINDPRRAVERLISYADPQNREALPLLGIITECEQYRMVCYDAAEGRFFYSPRRGEKRSISWSEIRDLASAGRTGGPSGTLEYLFFAACGFYLIVDCADTIQPFHRRACNIHDHYTGLKFPWLSFRMLQPDGREMAANSLLECYRHGFASIRRATLQGFHDR